jgi:hypothetical protein
MYKKPLHTMQSVVGRLKGWRKFNYRDRHATWYRSASGDIFHSKLLIMFAFPKWRASKKYLNTSGGHLSNFPGVAQPQLNLL